MTDENHYHQVIGRKVTIDPMVRRSRPSVVGQFESDG